MSVTIDRATFELPSAIRTADNLPSLPTVALEVLRISRDPDADVSELASAIAVDPALTLKITRLANSPQYRRGGKITSLSQATGILGMKTVNLLALSFSLTKVLQSRKGNADFDFDRYWRHSLVSAVAARCLSRFVKSPHREEAFLCGLLSRLGQLVMATTIPKEYDAVLERTLGDLPTESAEQACLGYDFHLVGQALLEEWGLPDLISYSVGSWRSDASVDGRGDNYNEGADFIARVLEVSDAIASLVVGQENTPLHLNLVNERARCHFGLAEEETNALILALQAEVQDTAAVLDVELPGDTDYQNILDDARAQSVNVGLQIAFELQEMQHQANKLEEQNRELNVVAMTDKLTGLANRGCFDERLQRVIAARLTGEYSGHLGILIMDIDHFKSFNDTYGHLAGDQVLKAVAARLLRGTRDTDFIARYGGEEFVAILPNTTVADLESVAERIRSQIEREVVEVDDKRLNVTISVGGACVNNIRTAQDGERLLEQADECLYQAKDAGRNRWVCQEVDVR